MMAPIGVLAVLTIAVGLVAGPVFDIALRSAEQLLDRRDYVEAVLGVRP